MKTLVLNKDHFDNDKKYIGDIDVSDYQGNVEIEASLGFVIFNKLIEIDNENK